MKRLFSMKSDGNNSLEQISGMKLNARHRHSSIPSGKKMKEKSPKTGQVSVSSVRTIVAVSGFHTWFNFGSVSSNKPLHGKPRYETSRSSPWWLTTRLHPTPRPRGCPSAPPGISVSSQPLPTTSKLQCYESWQRKSTQVHVLKSKLKAQCQKLQR